MKSLPAKEKIKQINSMMQPNNFQLFVGKIKKVKVTLVQALRLCTGLGVVQRVGRSIALPFHDHGSRRG